MRANTPQPLAEAFSGWDGSPAKAREMQKQLAGQVVLEDDFGPLRLIAGVDVGFEEAGKITRAAVVLLDADTLEPVDQTVARVPTGMNAGVWMSPCGVEIVPVRPSAPSS